MVMIRLKSIGMSVSSVRCMLWKLSIRMLLMMKVMFKFI